MPAFADKEEEAGEREGVSDNGRGAAAAGRESALAGASIIGSSSGGERGEEFGAGEEENEDSEEGASVGGGLLGLILYGVIAAVIGTIGYTAYKIFIVSRKKAPSSSVPSRSP